MTRVTRLTFLAIFLFPALAHTQTPAIEYRIGMSKPWTHCFEVELTIKGLPPLAIGCRFPAAHLADGKVCRV